MSALLGAGRCAVEGGVVDPEMRRDGVPLLHLAVSWGAVELARYLIFDRGVDPIVKAGSQNLTALHLAASTGHNEAALFLINDVPGVDLNALLSNGATPLMISAASGTLQVVRALVAKGADMNAKDGDGKTAVAFAVVAGQ